MNRYMATKLLMLAGFLVLVYYLAWVVVQAVLAHLWVAAIGRLVLMAGVTAALLEVIREYPQSEYEAWQQRAQVGRVARR